MTIQVFGISGSPIKDGNTDLLLQKALEYAASADDVTTEFFSLAGKKISSCIHCNYCAKKQTSERLCSISDDLDEILPKIVAADAIILATPVYVGRLSGHMASLLDRFRLFMHGKVVRNALENKIGAGIAVCYLRNNGVELTLQTLYAAFDLFHMIPVSPHGSLFGAGVLSSYHGEGKVEKDDYHSILKDEYGLKITKLTAARVVEVTRIVKAGIQHLKELGEAKNTA